jgi:hypothetical protein
MGKGLRFKLAGYGVDGERLALQVAETELYKLISGLWAGLCLGYTTQPPCLNKIDPILNNILSLPGRYGLGQRERERETCAAYMG